MAECCWCGPLARCVDQPGTVRSSALQVELLQVVAGSSEQGSHLERAALPGAAGIVSCHSCRHWVGALWAHTFVHVQSDPTNPILVLHGKPELAVEQPWKIGVRATKVFAV